MPNTTFTAKPICAFRYVPIGVVCWWWWCLWRRRGICPFGGVRQPERPLKRFFGILRLVGTATDTPAIDFVRLVPAQSNHSRGVWCGWQDTRLPLPMWEIGGLREPLKNGVCQQQHGCVEWFVFSENGADFSRVLKWIEA